MEELKAQVGALNNGYKSTPTYAVKPPKIPNSHSERVGNLGVDRRKFNKRHPDSGRKTQQETLIKRGIKQWIDNHANEEVPVTLIDRSTGKTITVKKSRRMIVIEKLFEIGTKGDKVTGNAHALSMWLDRYMGKAAQPIRGEGEDDLPFKFAIPNLDEIIEKAYGDKK